jgi:hypothetical protein
MTTGADVGGPGIGTIVQLGFAAADWLNRNTGLSPAERANIEAAAAAGWRRRPFRGRAAYFDPQGNLTTEKRVIEVGAAIRAGIAPTVPTQPGPVTSPPPTAPPPIYYPTTQPQPKVPSPDIPESVKRQAKRSRENPRQQRRLKKRPVKPREVPKVPKRPWWQSPPAPEPKWRPPKPIIDPNLPYEVAARSRWAILGTIGAILAGVLYPTPTASDDTIPGRPPGSQRGPLRRPKIRPRPPQQPKPSPVEVPGRRPDIVSQPQPGTPQRPKPTVESRPGPGPTFDPTQIPAPQLPTPSPRAWSIPKPLQYAAPFLVPFLTPTSSSKPKPAPATAPTGAPSIPLTTFQPDRIDLPEPETDPCKRSRGQKDRKDRKRKKRKCTNPITSRRTFTRDGQKFRSITRKLQCQP